MLAAKKWIPASKVSVPSDVLDEAGGNDIIAQRLVSMGITSAGRAKSFLDPAYYSPADPFDLSDMEKSVSRIIQAIKQKEVIGIWGDFDVDGQTSTSILVGALLSLGARVEYHIPVREHESHGILVPFLNDFLAKGIDLVITCDTGISGNDAADRMLSLGKDLIITDHHALPETLPNAYAIVSSQLVSSKHPLRTLSGAGVAYKVIEAVSRAMNRPEVAAQQLDLVALGLVADVADLVNDTRYLTQMGLSHLRLTERPGLREVYRNAQVNPMLLNEEHIGFQIGPRLNAIGRLSDANPIVELMTSQDPGVFSVIATQLEGLNSRRKLLTDQVLKSALELIERSPDLAESPAVILSQPNWLGGVVGIVAGRLVELFGKPAILLNSKPDGTSSGSARSVGGVNIIEAISNASHLLNGFGGHPMAAGMSLQTADLPKFRQLIYEAVAKQREGKPAEPSIEISAEVPLSEMSLENVKAFEKLAPFGTGNPPLIFQSDPVVCRKIQKFGKTREHLKIDVEDSSGRVHKLTWWSGLPEYIPESEFHLAYKVRTDSNKGKDGITFEWVDAHSVTKSTPIDLRRESPIEFIDCRLETDSAIVDRLPNDESVLLLAEGNSKLAGAVNRDQLRKSRVLVFLNAPPSQTHLANTIKSVSPKTVTFLNLFTPFDDLNSCLKAFIGMLKFAFNHLDRSFMINMAAAKLGVTEPFILYALVYAKSLGIFDFEVNGESVHLSESLETNKSAADQSYNRLRQLWDEMAAFRTFYGNASLSDLIQDL